MTLEEFAISVVNPAADLLRRQILSECSPEEIAAWTAELLADVGVDADG